jgi:hypothetical protein
MIKSILDLLQVVDGETENIRIAQGKEGVKQTKRKLRWHKK